MSLHDGTINTKNYFIKKLYIHSRTLNNNNLTTLPRDMFSNMPRLRALRLSENPFSCDCHLSWLSKYLRSAPRLAPYTRCHSPSQLKGQNVADLHDQEFKCSGTKKFYHKLRDVCLSKRLIYLLA